MADTPTQERPPAVSDTLRTPAEGERAPINRLARLESTVGQLARDQAIFMDNVLEQLRGAQAPEPEPIDEDGETPDVRKLAIETYHEKLEADDVATVDMFMAMADVGMSIPKPGTPVTTPIATSAARILMELYAEDSDYFCHMIAVAAGAWNPHSFADPADAPDIYRTTFDGLFRFLRAGDMRITSASMIKLIMMLHLTTPAALRETAQLAGYSEATKQSSRVGHHTACAIRALWEAFHVKWTKRPQSDRNEAKPAQQVDATPQPSLTKEDQQRLLRHSPKLKEDQQRLLRHSPKLFAQVMVGEVSLEDALRVVGKH